jgi:hypothetical protein
MTGAVVNPYPLSPIRIPPNSLKAYLPVQSLRAAVVCFNLQKDVFKSRG